MSSKERHLEYIRQKGSFSIDCSLAIFSSEEIEILEKWGHWFKALVDGELEPFTESQKRFIEVIGGSIDPFSLEEVAWNKYINRKIIEKESGDSLKASYIPENDTFYPREDIDKMNRINYGTISQIHHRGLSEK